MKYQIIVILKMNFKIFKQKKNGSYSQYCFFIIILLLH